MMKSFLWTVLLFAVSVSCSSSSSAPATYWCDDHDDFYCVAPSTCYTGVNGYLGCCPISSCAAVTTCSNWASSYSSPCNVETGGCFGCTTHPGDQFCQTFTNIEAKQWYLHCNTENYGKHALTSLSFRNGIKASRAPAQLPRVVSATTTSSSPTEMSTTSWGSMTSQASFGSQSQRIMTTTTTTATSSLSSRVGSSSLLPSSSAQPSSTSSGVKLGLGIGIPAAAVVLAIGFVVWCYHQGKKAKAANQNNQTLLAIAQAKGGADGGSAPSTGCSEQMLVADAAREAAPFISPIAELDAGEHGLPRRQTSIRSTHANDSVNYLSPLEMKRAERAHIEQQARIANARSARQQNDEPAAEIYELEDTSGWVPPVTPQMTNANPSGRWTPGGQQSPSAVYDPRLSHVSEATHESEPRAAWDENSRRGARLSEVFSAPAHLSGSPATTPRASLSITNRSSASLGHAISPSRGIPDRNSSLSHVAKATHESEPRVSWNRNSFGTARLSEHPPTPTHLSGSPATTPRVSLSMANRSSTSLGHAISPGRGIPDRNSSLPHHVAKATNESEARVPWNRNSFGTARLSEPPPTPTRLPSSSTAASSVSLSMANRSSTSLGHAASPNRGIPNRNSRLSHVAMATHESEPRVPWNGNSFGAARFSEPPPADTQLPSSPTTTSRVSLSMANRPSTLVGHASNRSMPDLNRSSGQGQI